LSSEHELIFVQKKRADLPARGLSVTPELALIGLGGYLWLELLTLQ
jgi:hypothetical protein